MSTIPTNVGRVQNLPIRPDVTLDQDGNHYANALAKYGWFRDCIEQGVRPGNLQPITTVNQCLDLIERMNAAARECGMPELPGKDAERFTARYAEQERIHPRRLALYRKLEAAYIDRGAEAWDYIYSLTAEQVEAKLAEAA